MHPDVVELKRFYATPTGDAACRLLGAAIKARLPRTAGCRVLGLGFTTPYLALVDPAADLVVAAMPAAQGALVWPPHAPALRVPAVELRAEDAATEPGGATPAASPPARVRLRKAGLLVDPVDLPFAEGSLDVVLAVHALEFETDPGALLAELWRVLAPGGRVLLAVPSRLGLWARADATPFGHGRPYSRSQLEALLGDALFTIESFSDALHAPPMRRALFLRSAPALDRLLGRMSWPFAGVHLVEASKQIHRPVLVRAPRRAGARLRPALAPASRAAG